MSGLYYKHSTIVNDDSSIVNEIETSLTDGARVINYDHHMFMVQATSRSCRQPVNFFPDATTTVPTPQKIIVNVASKEIQLPTNSAKLSAFVVPDEPQNAKVPYEYEWKLISGPPKGEIIC